MGACPYPKIGTLRWASAWVSGGVLQLLIPNSGLLSVTDNTLSSSNTSSHSAFSDTSVKSLTRVKERSFAQVSDKE